MSAAGPPPAPAAGPGQFIGQWISLTSKSEHRYKGILSAINPAEATISLEKVRSYGTEGRLAVKGRPADELPANDKVFDVVVFRASDVLDLKIEEAPPTTPQPPPPPPQLTDPAILNVRVVRPLVQYSPVQSSLVQSSPVWSGPVRPSASLGGFSKWL